MLYLFIRKNRIASLLCIFETIIDVVMLIECSPGDVSIVMSASILSQYSVKDFIYEIIQSYLSMST